MELLESHLHKQIQTFTRQLRSQAHRLSIEGVHQLRVSTRRLRATLALLKENGHSIPSDLSDSLKALRQALGDRRQWDVALRGAQKYHLEDGRLRMDQEAAGLLLVDTLKDPGVEALPGKLKELDKSLKNKNIEIQKKSFKKMRKEMKNWLKSKNLSAKKMHELRIATKKIRYAFEALDLPTEKLAVLQDHLGKSHDLNVLCEYFDAPKSVKRDEKRERKKAKKQIRPALRSSLEVLDSLR